MSKRIFLNNFNSFVAQALFQQLRNDVDDNDDPNKIFGTYIEKDSSEKPKGVTKMLKRSKPKLKAKYISQCDILIFDLHETAVGQQTIEDVKAGLEALKKHNSEDQKVVIIISSLMVWGNTPPKMVPKDKQKKTQINASGEDGGDDTPAEDPAPVAAQDSEDQEKKEGQGEENNAEQEEKKEQKVWVAWDERDFPERVPSPGYEQMKQIQDLLLEYKKENVKIYVICCGILYGLGQTVFYEHFKSAWLQMPQQLPYISFPSSIDKSILYEQQRLMEQALENRPQSKSSHRKTPEVSKQSINISKITDKSQLKQQPSQQQIQISNIQPPKIITEEQLRGSNLIPTIHIRDLARLVQKVIEAKPEQQYLLAIDCTQNRQQKALVHSISKGIGTGEFGPLPQTQKEQEVLKLKIEMENQHVRILSDNRWRQPLSINLKMRPSSLLIGNQALDEDGNLMLQGGDEDPDATGEQGADFEWHSKKGISQNVSKILEEFNKVRGLRPVRVLLSGPPCVGKSYYSAKLAEHYNIPVINRATVRKIMEDPQSEIMKNLAEIQNQYQLACDRDIEVIKMRLRENDCRNRGYILDGQPQGYTNALQVFMDFPRKKKPKPKPKKVKKKKVVELQGEQGQKVQDMQGEKEQKQENGEEEEEEEEVDEEDVDEENKEGEGNSEQQPKLKRPKIARDLIPESVIRFKAEQKTLTSNANNSKMNMNVFKERLEKYQKLNSNKNYRLPGRDPPIERFFQLDNKTEILELCVEGQRTSEVFESLRIYIERNQRPYNYLATQDELNIKREQQLSKEEKEENVRIEDLDKKQAFKNQYEIRKQNQKQNFKSDRQAAAERRLLDFEEHEGELKQALNLGQRYFHQSFVIFLIDNI